MDSNIEKIASSQLAKNGIKGGVSTLQRLSDFIKKDVSKSTMIGRSKETSYFGGLVKKRITLDMSRGVKKSIPSLLSTGIGIPVASMMHPIGGVAVGIKGMESVHNIMNTIPADKTTSIKAFGRELILKGGQVHPLHKI